MIFERRAPYASEVAAPEAAAGLDRYLESRDRFKEAFVAELAGALRSGPVLDWSGGYGSTCWEAVRTRRLRLCVACEGPWSEERCRARLRQRGLADDAWVVRSNGAQLPVPNGTFDTLVSVNFLHWWDDPTALFREGHRVLRPGGSALWNDVRRDANPFITEYVLRELRGDPSAEAQHDARTFARSLCSAHSVAEIEHCLHRSGLGGATIDADEPVTFTVRFSREG